MHAAAAAARAARDATEKFRHQFARRQSLCERMAMAAVRAKDCVFVSEMGTDPGGNCLLTDVGVTRAVNQSPLMHARELFLAQANEQHFAIEVEKQIARADGSLPFRAAGVEGEIATVHRNECAGDP